MNLPLLLEAWVTLLVMRIGLWFLPWRIVSRAPMLVARRAGVPVERSSAAIRMASRYVPYATCLTQALALRWLLARHGRVAILNLGVRNPPGGRLQAHAWLEAGGRVILGDPGSVEYERLHP
ncbi:MAG: lasso peptide biosynthesis B2 protein [Acidobacteria bacterium]|nr:MAG: lasso peptide biosynthesis B2 protein [Acidobacteriota bacterium]